MASGKIGYTVLMCKVWQLLRLAPSLLPVLMVAGCSTTQYPDQALVLKAEGGDSDAQIELARLYYEGEEVSGNDEEAVRWWLQAASRGYARAQNNLGVAYADGRGVAGDRQQAIKWYKKAAEQGLAVAQYNLGNLYGLGRPGAARDAEQAAVWWRRAAIQGLTEAQFDLGLMYFQGDGIERDYVEAYAWFDLAAPRGHPQASRGREQVAGKMTPVQLEQAAALAEQYRKQLP